MIMMKETTIASMTITNDYLRPLVSTTSTNMNMKDTFPSQTIGAGRTSSLSYISTGTAVSQSYFDVAYGSTTIKVNMGQGSYVTDASFFGSEGQAGALLAPTKPFSNHTDYIFYFFGGPGILPPLINSFIAANIPALLAYVSANPLHVDLSDGIKLIIKQLDITPQTIQCRYAALSPAPDQTNNQQWHINMIFNVNGQIFGSLEYHSMSMDLNATLAGSSMLIQAFVNMDDPRVFSRLVTKLAFSFERFTINNDLLVLFQTFFSTWYKLIDTPYHLASTLNTKYNTFIVDKLNIAVSKLINTTSFKNMFKNNSMVKKSFHDDVYPMERSEMGYSRWMSVPKIQSKTIAQLKIPGTHNSGSYGLTRKLSQIMYGNIKFLWDLSADTAPANGQFPFSEGKIYVGRILLDYIIDTTLRISIAQNRTIGQQLNDGIRFFDLRLYYDTDASFYMQHSLRGPQLEDVLAQIRNFFDTDSTSGELVFLCISHTNFRNDPIRLPARVATIIQNYLKPYLYMPANSVGVKDFDLQSLKDVTLSSITTTDGHGVSPKVIVLNTDNAEDYYYNDTVVNTRGFFDSRRWEINSNGVNSVAELNGLEGQELEKNTKPMYHISWIQTSQITDIIQSVLSHLSGNAPAVLLKQLALDTNSALQVFLANHTTDTFNLITLDWYHISSSVNPVDMIIGLNS